LVFRSILSVSPFIRVYVVFQFIFHSFMFVFLSYLVSKLVIANCPNPVAFEHFIMWHPEQLFKSW